MTSLAVALAVLAGLAGSVQVAVMGRFGGRIGVFGVVQIAISPVRAVGIALLGIGAALSLVR